MDRDHEHTYGIVGDEVFCIDDGCGTQLPAEDRRYFSHLGAPDACRYGNSGGEVDTEVIERVQEIIESLERAGL